MKRILCLSREQLTHGSAAANGPAQLLGASEISHQIAASAGFAGRKDMWRWYSSSADSGSQGSGSNRAAGLEEGSPEGALPSAQASAAVEDFDAALDQWGSAMDSGDWERAWEIFETQFPVDTPLFPSLEDLLAWDPDGETKAVRRQREFDLQEDAARLRVRKVDAAGMAHGVGKRKTSVARVWIREGAGHIMVNRRPFDAYFTTLHRRNDLITPFLVTDTLGKFDVMAAVEGGGITGQAQAMRHGIARALQHWEPEMRPELKAAGLLTRDSRIVERKKPGRKKARKAFQWVKR